MEDRIRKEVAAKLKREAEDRVRQELEAQQNKVKAMEDQIRREQEERDKKLKLKLEEERLKREIEVRWYIFLLVYVDMMLCIIGNVYCVGTIKKR